MLHLSDFASLISNIVANVKNSDVQGYLVIQPSILLAGLWVLCLFRCLVLLQVDREQLGEGNGCQDANTGGESQHQSDHHARKVDGRDGVQDDEDASSESVLELASVNFYSASFHKVDPIHF